ncbi:MFS transporter [Piscirickettsia litoralis]|uniref:Major facilitator superfamily (MFS) profile domain-containing protein n=1 Tax=Piscirickettsia litoralis TaxID=1891921 RepID=A0ABX3A0I3_9GAMM|nr:MFS transporter [Piscirickettsia litoralis]ODN42372.1 hypothetical protein BGC07_04775 [Piscirickettsia litoralis]
MIQNSKNHHRFTLTLILLVVPLSGAGIDIYVPSLPAIQSSMGVSHFAAKVTVALYLFGYGFGQLIIGPLSDRYGRRWIVIVSLLLYALSSFGASVSPNIEFLWVMRIIQGAVVSGILVPARASISDLFTGTAYLKAMNYSTVAWAMGPILAPAIGGYLQVWGGWHVPFYALALYSAVMAIIMLLVFKETKRKTTDKFIPLRQLVVNYGHMLRSFEFMAGVACLSLLYSVLTVFNVVGPFLIQSQLGLSPIFYGHVALWLGLAWFLGTVSYRFAIRFSALRVGLSYLSVAVLIALSMVIESVLYGLSVWGVVLPTLVLGFCAGAVFSQLYGRCIALYPNTPASAGALMGSIFVVGAGLVSALASQWQIVGLLPLALINFGLVLSAAVLFLRQNASLG